MIIIKCIAFLAIGIAVAFVALVLAWLGTLIFQYFYDKYDDKKGAG